MVPQVMTYKEADIGEWDDNHPLNFSRTPNEEINEYFKENNDETQS
jgi:hypothetical protein